MDVLGPAAYAPNLESQTVIDNNDGTMRVIQLSSSTVYIIGSVISLLLVLNLSCLCYNHCHSSKKMRRYRKVSQIVSSDDDMENMKEVVL